MQTNYILRKNGLYTEHETLLDVASEFSINITDNGKVTCDDIVDSVSYNMKQWTKVEAISDFIKNRRMCQILPNVKLFSVE